MALEITKVDSRLGLYNSLCTRGIPFDPEIGMLSAGSCPWGGFAGTPSVGLSQKGEPPSENEWDEYVSLDSVFNCFAFERLLRYFHYCFDWYHLSLFGFAMSESHSLNADFNFAKLLHLRRQ